MASELQARKISDLLEDQHVYSRIGEAGDKLYIEIEGPEADKLITLLQGKSEAATKREAELQAQVDSSTIDDLIEWLT